MQSRFAILLAALVTGCSSSGGSGGPSVRCVGAMPTSTIADCDPATPMTGLGSPTYEDMAGQKWEASCSDGELICDTSGAPTRWTGAVALCMGYTPSCANGSAPRCRPVSCATGDAGM